MSSLKDRSGVILRVMRYDEKIIGYFVSGMRIVNVKGHLQFPEFCPPKFIKCPECSCKYFDDLVDNRFECCDCSLEVQFDLTGDCINLKERF